MDSVEAALSVVPSDFYMREPDGRRLPQTSNPEVIAALLRLGDIRPRDRALEIGTGSGFSAALLAHMVGPSGTVTSLEVDTSVAERAGRLLAEQGVDNARVLAVDGRRGCPEAAPFDRVIAWATAETIPHEWVRQTVIGGLIIAPVQIGSLAHAATVARLRCENDETIVGEQMIAGSFVPLTETAQTNWGEAPARSDILVDADSDPAEWLSAPWLRTSRQAANESRLRLRYLCHFLRNVSEQSPFTASTAVEAFRAYLLAVFPAELTTAYLRSTGRAIGCSRADGIALFSLRDSSLCTAGTDAALEVLLQWVADWKSLGCPGFDRLRPVTEQTAKNEWRIRAEIYS